MRPTLARAEGIHVWDVEGRRYVDGTSGAFCVNLGYTRPDLAAALAETAARLPHARPSRFDSEERLRYEAALLAAAAPPFARVALTSSGSEAVEAALKIAWRWHAAAGRPERRRFLSLDGHYHGATLAALDVTGVGARRDPYAALLGARAFGPHADCARCFRDLTHPDCALACADAAFEAGGAEAGVATSGRAGKGGAVAATNRGADVAALIAETVPASGLAAPVPPAGWLARVRARCDAMGALWIADEVLAGFGRAGDLFAWRRLAPDAVPDLVVFGKGAGAGFAPLAGVLVSGRVAASLPEDFAHHQTYGGAPTACAVGLRVLAALEEERIVAGVREREGAFAQALAPLAGHPRVRAVRGIGFLRGVLLRDAAAAAIVEACRERGLLLHAAGKDGILLAPPLVATAGDLEGIAATLSAALG
ncbi:MAG: aminotransferase class III-fold pyridoxal phosphate-dependent enzyme [Hyphomicrobiales bacterium]